MRLISNHGLERVVDLLPAGEAITVATTATSVFGIPALIGTRPLSRLLLTPEVTLRTDADDRRRRNELSSRGTALLAQELIKMAEIRVNDLTLRQSLILSGSPRAVRAVVGDCDLTTAGLGLAPSRSASMFQLLEHEAEIEAIAQWFDAQWQSAVSPDTNPLIAALDRSGQAFTPAEIYCRGLASLFADMVINDDALPDKRLGLEDSLIRTRVLMLSATPVNNRLNDLKNQIAFATEGNDEALADAGIKSITGTVRLAQAAFNKWQGLPTDRRTSQRLLDMLGFDYVRLLDLLTIARSRKHIERYYGIGETGRFPQKLPPDNRKIDVASDGGFPPIAAINDEIRRLTLAAYAPLRYVLENKRADYDRRYSQTAKAGESVFRQLDREESLVGLMRVNLLMDAILFGGAFAEKFHGIAPLDHRDALGDRALQFDRADFAAVLRALKLALRRLVAVEFALDPVARAVEEIDDAPEQVLEIGFDPRIDKAPRERIEDVGDGAAREPVVGQRTAVGFVLEGAVAI